MYLTVNNASAGSGKTFTLSAEYVADLIAELLEPTKSLPTPSMPIVASWL